MRRRTFLGVSASAMASIASTRETGQAAKIIARPGSEEMRALFPRCQHEIFLNAAGGTPLSRFTERGLRRYEEFWRLGPADGRGQRVQQMLSGIRSSFARMIGAEATEIGLVHCTKAGEQIVLDGLPDLRKSGNVVTNDLHFAGSLHNLIGLRAAGLDVRIIRSRDWKTDLDRMRRAIDEGTALVSISLVSNINGHVEPINELASIAHEKGALVYADVIQAAGIHPIDVRAMGIDFAACSGYKWLYGPHGVGFLYVRKELSGTVLQDRLFPGSARHNYAPWVDEPDNRHSDFHFTARQDASRYQPGHISYLGYSALYEALQVVLELGPAKSRSHSGQLNRTLVAGLDPSRYRSISPNDSPILTLLVENGPQVRERLVEHRITASVAGNRLRISPGLYNNEEDMVRLARVLQSI